MENLLLTLIIGISVVGLVAALMLAKWVMSKSDGTEPMRAISDAIKEGANAFLKRQYKTIVILASMVAAALFIGYGMIREHQSFDPVESRVALAMWITLSFVFGAVCSLFAGYIGMWVSIRSNIRTAAAAVNSVNDALRIALRGGAVSGLMVVSMSLLGVAGLYILVKFFTGVEATKIPFMIVGYGFGASFVALFAQLGGGIYTKAADVGADLVGKVEAGIPEDDPRNPAVIADLVGDNVGDCAGRGADIFESAAAENIGAMILAGVMAKTVPGADPVWIIGVMLFPLLARAFGIIASIIGVLTVKIADGEDPMHGLNKGYFITVFFTIIGLFVASKWLFYHQSAPHAWLYLFFAGVVGVLTSIAFIYITEYYTEYKYRPVRSIANASQTGPATNIITGIAMGLECTAPSAIVISISILAAYYLGQASGFPNAGIFGTAVATMGMLGPAAYILAMDTFGPISDNAGGIIEMTEQSKEVRERTDRLDAAGNTTKALTKGYAIASAALASFLLFRAYLDEVENYGHPIKSVDLAEPVVFVGALLGAALVFIFSALAIMAVGRAAYYVIWDVRDQFKEKPGILAGTEKPDYGRCVDIVTKGALKEMVVPGLVAVLTPIVVGVLFKQLGAGAEAVASMLMVGTIAGILMATFLNNGGGAWDNAKKYIETGQLGGKGSDTHKAAVVGDTVGDPFKDTAGPSLHVLIKLLSTVTLVLAPLFI
ncbi:sodium-translocating pyrophosphatase [Candidatus Magnetominusculus xianensis]|uniref:K(+)-insensitive pyrophosphate-energized proton pump n=1 Tax=Candidatus Magnetominusculus xianensis TaxID=1748249 RepID=A0ABR5SDK3_9BACT|nr:sodium-translocating pyrophosphatase [Candidatus Magnetominusculus xianensis]KWT83006.1 pyrophosphatase [Candidatus Magnetominusculus xianensis]MBF0402716.1 sodium-translocating pyrophosphatase [Nitrospirota bacterium]